MMDDARSDEKRLFQGPGTLVVFVPPKPPPHPDDFKRDFPPGFPPEVIYQGVSANYRRVLEESQMLFMGGTKVFTKAEMEWLRSIEREVESFLLAS
jgi:hypothetical protein